MTSLSNKPSSAVKNGFQTRNPQAFVRGDAGIPVIAICHLSWDWVWQRPQQFLSRLARSHPVLFVETHPSDVVATETSSRSAPHHPNVTILKLHLPAARWADSDFIDTERRRILQHQLRSEFAGQYDGAVLWINDPMAAPAYVGHLGERLVVYDCMDELSQFKDAPPALAAREAALVRRADLVFCGGRKMREKRLPLNPRTFFFGTGVDCEHFGKALRDDFAGHPLVAALPQPVLGYFGVIDERIDYQLLTALADGMPESSVVMVGPYAKIDPATLPRRPNLHWLGGQPYLDLPSLAKCFQVALMPFALNAATEYINPTKALEYMATGRPIVSTALDEVKTNFARVVRIATDADRFIALCRAEAARPSASRVKAGRKLAEENTWERIVDAMEDLIRKALEATSPARPGSLHPAPAPLPNRSLPAYV